MNYYWGGDCGSGGVGYLLQLLCLQIGLNDGDNEGCGGDGGGFFYYCIVCGEQDVVGQ